VTVHGTVTDGSGHGYPLYTRIEIDGRPGGPIYTDPVTGEYSVSLPQGADYDITYTAQLPGYQEVTDTVSVGSSDVTHDVAVPVDPSCTSPGYAFNTTEALSQDFNSGTQPAGWQVTDDQGSGETWAFQDAGNRGNLTGGGGSFAIVDSDHFGLDTARTPRSYRRPSTCPRRRRRSSGSTRTTTPSSPTSSLTST